MGSGAVVTAGAAVRSGRAGLPELAVDGAERSSRTVGEVPEAWLERGRGKKDPWDAPTRERHDRIVRQQVLASADPTRRPLGETKLRDLTPDSVAVWSQGSELALAPGTALLALIAVNQIGRYASGAAGSA